GKFTGWSYRKGGGVRADHSNTQWAVQALRAAKFAGARFDDKIWREIRDFYLSEQGKDGGWPYIVNAKGTPSLLTMTLAGLCGLQIADEQLGGPTDASKQAVQKGLDFLVSRFKLPNLQHPEYYLYGLGRLGRLSKAPFLEGAGKRIDWFRDGTTWVMKTR